MEVGAARSARHEVPLYSAAVLSLLAALLHLWAMPGGMRQSWGFGTFLLVSAMAQGAYGTVLLRWPTRSLFLAGLGSNLLILALYLSARTVGVPFFGPHAGGIGGFGLVGLCASAAEAGVVLALVALLTRGISRERKMQVAIVLTAAALLVGHLVHLLAERNTTGHG